MCGIRKQKREQAKCGRTGHQKQNQPLPSLKKNSIEMSTCSNPGRDQPGTHQCSACKKKNYCSPSCQTADWPIHKEECPGHLRKVGLANLEKARGFDRVSNLKQTFRYADLAANK